MQLNEKKEIHGNFAQLSATSLMLQAKKEQFSGFAVFRYETQQISLAFSNGQIIYAGSNNNDLRLGEILLARAEITLDQYLESVEHLLATGKRQGELLIADGHLTQEQCTQALMRQAKEIIYTLLHWPNQTQYTIRQAKPNKETTTLSVSTYELILRGMQREQRFSVLEKVLVPWQQKVVLNTTIDLNEAKRIRLKTNEQIVLQAIDGKTTIRQLASKIDLPDLQIIQIIYALKHATMIDFV